MTTTVEEIVPGRTAIAVYLRQGLSTRRISLTVVGVEVFQTQVNGALLTLPLLVLEDGTTVVADPRLPIEVVTP